MSPKYAEENLKGMGHLVARNAPGPRDLARGFWDLRAFWIFYAAAAALCLVFK